MGRFVVFLLAAALAGPAGRAASPDFTAAIASEELVAGGAPWRFFRGRAEPAGGTLDWTKPGFDDGAWETGAAGFGYGDGDDATVLSDMAGRYSTVYLRTDFEVPEPDRAAALELTIDYDDGFIAFINGTEVARANAGPRGTYPLHDGLAEDSHEAGTPRVVPILAAGSFLIAGTNILAVVGLNDDRDSSDFSLHPKLRSAGALAEGCPGDFYVGGGAVLVAGTAPPTASAVRVNGALADVDPVKGTWSSWIEIMGGSTPITAEALDGTGGVLASATLNAIRVRPLAGELDADITLSASSNPHLVVDWVTVPAGRRLSIQAGCEILILPEVGFVVQGVMQGMGAVARPIRFTRVPCQANWGFFSFDGARGANTFRFCEWSFGGGDPGCLTLSESDLELYGCTLRDIDGEGVHAVECMTRIRYCLTERTQEALSLDLGDTVVEYCTVRDTIGKSDLIDVNGDETSPLARIAFNHIYNTSDDGIDADRGQIVIEGNVIHGCGDQAMSLVGAGTSTVRYNVCYGNDHGLSVKDSNECLAEHNTFVFNATTGVRAIEKTAGRGGGKVILRDSIVWGNGDQLFVDAHGSIGAAFCDIEGGLVPGEGNIGLDPLFADPAAGDFHLEEGSPCIGAASDGGDLGALPLDALPGSLLRGDANADRIRDVADAVRILSYLFGGGAAPPCLETADVNTDGRVDISDPVFLLRFLFGAGSAMTPDEAHCSG